MTDKNLAEKIRFLARKYETADFLTKDPSQFMHRFSDVRNQEAVAFISANLAFGRREQILSHVQAILGAAGNSPVSWILSENYKDFFHSESESELKKSFYRMYTNQDMILFFDGLKRIFESEKTAGEFFKKKWESKNAKGCFGNRLKGIFADGCNHRGYLHFVIEDAFDKKCRLIPHTKDSAAKKINMMLRWLVRSSSPVDLGLWTWFDKKNLLMPLDVHVMSQAAELGLIKSKSPNLKTAVCLTEKMKEIFPDDPLRADFALFGYDIDGAN